MSLCRGMEKKAENRSITGKLSVFAVIDDRIILVSGTKGAIGITILNSSQVLDKTPFITSSHFWDWQNRSITGLCFSVILLIVIKIQWPYLFLLQPMGPVNIVLNMARRHPFLKSLYVQGLNALIPHDSYALPIVQRVLGTEPLVTLVVSCCFSKIVSHSFLTRVIFPSVSLAILKHGFSVFPSPFYHVSYFFSCCWRSRSSS